MKTLTLMIVAAMVALAPSLSAGESVEAANEDLAKIESLAREVRNNAGTMQAFVRFPGLYSHSVHERKLARMKVDANELGDALQKLHKSRPELEDWQAELVTRVISRMDVLTDEIEHAIRYVDENPGREFRPVYEDYVDGIYDSSNSIVNVVDRYLDWADATS